MPEQLPGLAAGWGALDRELLPSLLHESTHHWCFLSPLGFSLAHLQTQAWANILTLDGQDDDQSDEANFRRFRVDDCVSRFQLVLEVLRPISEGLALFAEFDASSPPHSRVQAPPFELLMTLYSPRPKTTDEVDRMREQFYQFLAQERLGDQMLKRKANVLGSTLRDSDGYLLGYLFVRGAWTVAAAKNPAVRHDTDLWLRYVKSFFFDDFHWASLLLLGLPGGDENDLEEPLITISKYLASRVRELGKATAEDIEQFEIASADAANNPTAEIASSFEPVGLGVNSELYAAGYRVLEQVQEDLTAALDHSNELVRMLGLAANMTLSGRQLLYLGSTDAMVEVTAGRVRADAGSCIIEAPANPRVSDGAAQGHIEVCVAHVYKSSARVAVIARGEETVGCSVLDSPLHIGTLGKVTPHLKANRPIREQLIQQLKDAARRVRVAPAGGLLPKVQPILREYRNAVLIPAAMSCMAVRDRAMVQNRLIEPGGFAGLLGSKDCLVALTLTGLAGAADRNGPRIAAALTAANWPPADLAEAIAEAQARFGGTLWLLDGNDLLTVL